MDSGDDDDDSDDDDDDDDDDGPSSSNATPGKRTPTGSPPQRKSPPPRSSPTRIVVPAAEQPVARAVYVGRRAGRQAPAACRHGRGRGACQARAERRARYTCRELCALRSACMLCTPAGCLLFTLLRSLKHCYP